MNFDLLREIVKDLVGRVDFGVVVQMGVDVAGGSDVTVAQPLLDVLESHSVGVGRLVAGNNGGWVCFTNQQDGFSIYRVHTDGTSAEKLVDGY